MLLLLYNIHVIVDLVFVMSHAADVERSGPERRRCRVSTVL